VGEQSVKKFVVAAACAVLAVALGGCGKKAGNEPEKPVKATVRAEMADKSPQF